MSFANPAALWLLALAVPVLVLHILRPRRDEVDVSSVFLWRKVEVTVSAARPWQRLRPSLLLLLQLLAVVGLALAVARPVRVTESPVADHTVFIVDASGSMAARDGDPDRLADAVAEAKDLRDEIPDGGLASIVVADSQPRVVLTASGDGGAFDSALDSIEATPGSADFASAFLLAEGQETGEGDIAFVLLSDGGLDDDEQRLLPPGTTFRQVGVDATNRGITRLAVEPRGAGLFAVVALRNAGDEDVRQTLRLDVDGETAIEEQVDIPADDVAELTFELPAGERVEAFLQGEDLLDADDHVYAAAPPRRALDVAVYGEDDQALCALLEALASVERVDYTGCGNGEPPSGAAASEVDVAIYNQVPVPAEPPAPFWAIAPPDGLSGAVTVNGAVEGPVPTLVRNDDPLLVDLNLAEVLVGTAQQLDSPAGETLVGAPETPLLLRGRLGDVPYVYGGFPLTEQSTLPLQDAFPILGDRILAELAGAALPSGSLEVGDALPTDPVRATTIAGPGDLRLEIAAGQPAPHAEQAGLWTVQPEGQPARTLAVNPSPRETDVAPNDNVLAPERELRPGETLPRGQRSLLHWVIPPLLLILVAEWLLARRRRGVSNGQFRVATALRVLVALALVGALLDVGVTRKADQVAVTFVVDASDSLGSGGREEALDWVRDAVEQMPDDARAAVELFGGDARLELAMQSDPVLGPATVVVDPSRTNLAGALRQAASVLPTDARRRVVLVSDGRPTEGDVMAETERLRASGIPVDVHVVDRGGGPDAAVTDVEIPNRARQGEAVPVRVHVQANVDGPAQVALLRDGTVVDQQTVELAAGEEAIVEFSVQAEAPGVARYQAQVTFGTDTVNQNDVGYAAVQVEGPPTVLLLEGQTGAADSLEAALRDGGLEVEVREPGALPAYDDLANYVSIVLVDVPADAFTSDQVQALTAAVRDLGRGLLTVGGSQSYGLGGYLGSDLEELLPVISDILDPQRRQTVAEVLAIDTSGSMGACHCAADEGRNPGGQTQGGVQKTDIARAGAARAIEALSSNDEVGILAVDTEDEWVVDLQQLPAQEVLDEGLAHVTPSGESTDLSTSLATAAEELRQSHTSLKHVVLFTDGFVNDPGQLDDLAAQAADLFEEGITVSVIATGEGAEVDRLEAIAVAGGGRFYPGEDLQEIPQILQQETTIASRDFVNEGEFLPTVASNAAHLQDLSSPPLLGYVATTAKPEAETQLRIGPDEDPLLASWNVGLGRASSWTTDAGVRWAQTWLGWDGYVDFWTGVVSDTFSRRASGAAVTARVDDGVLQVRVEGDTPFPDGSAGEARVVGPDQQGHELHLERVGATTFAAELPVTAAGSYGVAAQVTPPGGGGAVGGDALANLAYSAEYELGEADPTLLERVSQATGGRGAIEPADAFDPDGLAAGRSRVDLARWLLLLAALLWPLAVALSRLALRGSVVGQVQHSGAVALWWVRRRIPRLPGRTAPTGAGPGDRKPTKAPPERPTPKPKPRPSTEERRHKEAAAAPTATLGSLLASQRKRRGMDTDDEDGP